MVCELQLNEAVNKKKEKETAHSSSELTVFKWLLWPSL